MCIYILKIETVFRQILREIYNSHKYEHKTVLGESAELLLRSCSYSAFSNVSLVTFTNVTTMLKDNIFYDFTI